MSVTDRLTEHDEDLQAVAGSEAVQAAAHGKAHRTGSDDIEKL